jgi:hypothetical protein
MKFLTCIFFGFERFLKKYFLYKFAQKIEKQSEKNTEKK